MDGKQRDHYVGPPRLIDYKCDVALADSKSPQCVLNLEVCCI